MFDPPKFLLVHRATEHVVAVCQKDPTRKGDLRNQSCRVRARLQETKMPPQPFDPLTIAITSSFKQMLSVRVFRRVVRAVLTQGSPGMRTIPPPSSDIVGLPTGSRYITDE